MRVDVFALGAVLYACRASPGRDPHPGAARRGDPLAERCTGVPGEHAATLTEALALYEAKGDLVRSEQLRAALAALGA